MTGKKLIFEPGERFAYSNIAFEILGDIISKISGLTFEEYIASNIPPLAEVLRPRLSALGPQEAKVSGKGLKETFELKVWDGERGGDRDLSDLSGGEQVIIDECLKAALALYARRHAQIPIETCWRDETTGPLDDENRARYVPMLRRLQHLGGFHTLLFVTHDAEIAAQADAQIQVGGGTARLVLASEVAA